MKKISIEIELTEEDAGALNDFVEEYCIDLPKYVKKHLSKATERYKDDKDKREAISKDLRASGC